MIPRGISSKFVNVPRVGRITFGTFTFDSDWVTEGNHVRYSGRVTEEDPDLTALTGCELIPVKLYRFGDTDPVVWGEAYVDFTYHETEYGKRLYGNLHFVEPVGWRL